MPLCNLTSLVRELATIILYPILAFTCLGFSHIGPLLRLGLWAPSLTALTVVMWIYYPLGLFWGMGRYSPSTFILFFGTYICICLGICECLSYLLHYMSNSGLGSQPPPYQLSQHHAKSHSFLNNHWYNPNHYLCYPAHSLSLSFQPPTLWDYRSSWRWDIVWVLGSVIGVDLLDHVGCSSEDLPGHSTCPPGYHRDHHHSYHGDHLLGDAPHHPTSPPIFLRHLCIFLLIVASPRQKALAAPIPKFDDHVT